MELLTEKQTFIEKKNSTLTTQDDKSLLVKFRLMGAEEQNENKRLYPAAVLKQAVEDLRGRLAKRKSSFAMNGHRDDENVDDVAAVLEDVEMTGTDVFATAKILPTQRGQNVQAIIRNGGSVGVSAKCTGSVKEGVVQPGLVLRGFDFTLAPGFGTFATKDSIIESVTVEDETDGAVTENQLKEFGLLPPDNSEESRRSRYAFALACGYKRDFQTFVEEVVLKMKAA